MLLQQAHYKFIGYFMICLFLVLGSSLGYTQEDEQREDIVEEVHIDLEGAVDAGVEEIKTEEKIKLTNIAQIRLSGATGQTLSGSLGFNYYYLNATYSSFSLSYLNSVDNLSPVFLGFEQGYYYFEPFVMLFRLGLKLDLRLEDDKKVGDNTIGLFEPNIEIEYPIGNAGIWGHLGYRIGVPKRGKKLPEGRSPFTGWNIGVGISYRF